MTSEEGSLESESNEDLAFITRKLQSILKRRKNYNVSSSSMPKQSSRQRSKHNINTKPSSNKKSDPIICYECKEEGHMHGECPKLKRMIEKKKKKDIKLKGKKTKAMVATWSNDDTSSDSHDSTSIQESDDEMCFMAFDVPE